MEVVGLIANIGQLIEITTKTIKYLNSVKDASKDRLKVTREASSLIPWLVDLQSQVDVNKNEEWSRCVRSLAAEHGPIDQLREALEQLAKKVKPKKGLKDALRAFVWTLDKAYTQDILGKIERVKSSVSLALQGDTIDRRKLGRQELIGGSKLLQAINADTAAIGGIDERVSVITSDIEKLRTEDELQCRENILEWLSPLNFFRTQQDTFARREEGTGQWFLDSPEFQDWLSGTNRTLCCPGIPGAGKSILASVVINSLRAYTKKESVGVAAIYCNFKERDSQSPENLLAGCCAQLVPQTLPQTLVDMHRMHSGLKTRPTWKDMIQIFEDIVKRLDTAYLVVDALDECSEDVRALLLTFFKTLPSHTRLLVTTRHINDITCEFRTAPMVEIRASLGDLEKYIASRVGSDRRLSGHVRSNGPLKQDICDVVASKAKGMFLAAKLHLDALSTKTSIKLLKKALKNLSTNINELYDDALLRIKNQNQDDRALAEKALHWVAFTYKPLPVEALQEAMAIEPGEEDFDIEALHRIDLVLDVCAGLLIHDEKTGIVRLVHYTAQDYFDIHAQSTFEKAHACIARDCITYLSYECFQNPEGFGDDSLDDRCYHLFKYATLFWAQHAMARPDPSLSIEVHQFLARDPRIHLPTASEYYYSFPKLVLPKRIYLLKVRHGCEIAAFFGLHDQLALLCEEMKEAEALPHLRNTSFHIAVSKGHARSMDILLDYGADINSESDRIGNTALHNASANGDPNIVSILLARGINLDPQDYWVANALLMAVERSHESCVVGLLAHGVDINTKDVQERTALHVASIHGELNILNLLLARGIDIDAHDEWEMTALLLAAENSHESCVLALLDHGADMDSRDRCGATALHLASRAGDLNVLNLLLARGIDIDAQDMWKMTALLYAVERFQEGCVLALIRQGANVNIQDGKGASPLHLVSATGTMATIAEMVEHHAVASTRSKAMCSVRYTGLESLNPLHYLYRELAFEGNEGVSHYLTTVPTLHDPSSLKSALPIAESTQGVLVWRNGLTALDIAMLREHDEIINLLKPLTPSRGEAVPVSFDIYLLDLLGVASIEEARETLERRIEEEEREAEAREEARSVYLCAWLGVASVEEWWAPLARITSAEYGTFLDVAVRDPDLDARLRYLLGVPPGTELWEELDQRISALKGTLKDEAFREAARATYFFGLLGVASWAEFWGQVDRRISAANEADEDEPDEETAGEEEAFGDGIPRGAARNAYLCGVLGIASGEDIWEEVDRRISAAEEADEDEADEDEAVKNEAVKEEAFSKDDSKDEPMSSTTSLEHKALIETIQ